MGTMMNRIRGLLVFFICTMVLLLALTGCQLAKESAPDEGARMVGVFITTEFLDLFDHSLVGQPIPMHRGRPDFTALFQAGRLYAEWDEAVGEFRFRDVEGFPFFTANSPPHTPNEIIISHVGEGITSGANRLGFSDNSVSIEMEGTIYIVPGAGAMSLVAMNPVYQTADGRVFVTTGGASMSGHGLDTEGRVFGTTITHTTTETINGVENTHSISVEVNIATMFRPEKILLLQMDEYSQIVLRTEFAPDEMPRSIYMEADTAYVIVETHRDRPDAFETVVRELVARSRHGQRFSTFMAREDGVLVKSWTEIVWAD